MFTNDSRFYHIGKGAIRGIAWQIRTSENRRERSVTAAA